MMKSTIFMTYIRIIGICLVVWLTVTVTSSLKNHKNLIYSQKDFSIDINHYIHDKQYIKSRRSEFLEFLHGFEYIPSTECHNFVLTSVDWLTNEISLAKAFYPCLSDYQTFLEDNKLSHLKIILSLLANDSSSQCPSILLYQSRWNQNFYTQALKAYCDQYEHITKMKTRKQLGGNSNLRILTVSEECKVKMKVQCKSTTYVSNVQCLFSNLDKLEYVCDESIVAGYLASIYPKCDKDLYGSKCASFLIGEYDSYDVMKCLMNNYGTISPSCRSAVENLKSSNVPCDIDSKKFCPDKSDIVDVLTCIADQDDSNISPTCLSTVQGYGRCKYPNDKDDDDGDISSSFDQNGEEDDDDEDDDDDDALNKGMGSSDTDDLKLEESSSPKKDDGPDLSNEGGRRLNNLKYKRYLSELQPIVRKQDVKCWAKTYILSDDDEDDDDGDGATSENTKRKSNSKGYDKSASKATAVPAIYIIGMSLMSIIVSVGIIYVIRVFWKRSPDGRGRYIRASTTDLDLEDDVNATASEEIIQSRLMDVGEGGSNAKSFAMRRLDGAYDNPFASKQKMYSSHNDDKNYSSLPDVQEPNLDYDSDEDDGSKKTYHPI